MIFSHCAIYICVFLCVWALGTNKDVSILVKLCSGIHKKVAFIVYYWNCANQEHSLISQEFLIWTMLLHNDTFQMKSQRNTVTQTFSFWKTHLHIYSWVIQDKIHHTLYTKTFKISKEIIIQIIIFLSIKTCILLENRPASLDWL